MEDKIKNASYNSKETFTLPEGAKVLKKDYNIRVEEIENGFIVIKSYDIQYQVGDNKDYGYYHKKWYSETNPLKIDIDDEAEQKYLADEF
jgi:hypothetical protein